MLYKKNKLGFTLIELLGIVIITGTIAALSYATLNNTIKKNKDSEFKTFENSIIIATKLYMTANNDKYEGLENVGDRVNITTNDLISSGYLKSTVKNPTDIPLDKYYVIVKVNNDSFYEYNLVSDDNKAIENLIYKEEILNGAVPKLTTEMIPVKYDSDGQTIKSSIYDEWYNYTNKEWANIVILKDTAKDKYKGADIGSVINNNDIQAYLVWIPRFKYKIFNKSENYITTKQTVDIIFENNKSKKSKGTKFGDYLTAPGFKYGDKELNGIWVGKFETSYSDSNSFILPNQKAETNKSILEFYKESLKFNEIISYGNSHVSKLSENAIINFISSSEYASSSIKLNYNSNSITGCGTSTETESTDCINPFGTTGSIYTQSNTGNQYGIFDLSGGSWEYLMAFKGNTDNVPYVGYDDTIKTGFEGLLMSNAKTTGKKLPEKYYYDIIPASSWSDLCGSDRFYGYGICETVSWNGDSLSYEGDNGGVVFRSGGSFKSKTGNYSMWPSTKPTAYDSYRMIITTN